MKYITIIVFSLFCIFIQISSKELSLKRIKEHSATVDNTTYIDANKIFMFVTNHGNFGRDLSGFFGYDYGTFYPYDNYYDLENGFNRRSPLYAGGIWVGGKVNDSIRVATSEYSSEYTPGPMVDSTFQPDSPEFRVYKLYWDSLENNPNDDYLNWPVEQGAPVDSTGKPVFKGHQMLWSVFNDADQTKHINIESEPLGIEIQHTTWAQYETGTDTTFYPSKLLINSDEKVKGSIINFDQLSDNEYSVIINYHNQTGNYWTLVNNTTNDTLLDYQTVDTSIVIDGFQLIVDSRRTSVPKFEVTANGSGRLDTSVAGAFSFRGFLTPNNENPEFDQQVGSGHWAIHTADNGGTNGGGSRGDISDFLERTFREPVYFERFQDYDWEIRFTGSNDFPGVAGSYAWNEFTTQDSIWVPFELWRLNPDNPAEQLRLIPSILDDGNYIFDMSSYGSLADTTCGPGGCEHSASSGDNDPYTDWIYWRIPADQNGNLAISGDSAYNVFEQVMKTDPTSWSGNEVPVMDRMVLINWNGHVTYGGQFFDLQGNPYFNQEIPELGTIFRISDYFDYKSDTFTFRPPQAYTVEYSTEHSSIYMQYKLYNKGRNYIDSCYISIWTDTDLGNAGDDLVGCDTLDDIMFTYNENNFDTNYPKTAPPAFGIKILKGPIVESIGDSGYFEDNLIIDSKNLDMTAFSIYIGGTDPDDRQQVYRYMKGLTRDGNDYIYDNNVTRFIRSGDPISGEGDLDEFSADRRMMGSMGPFNFAPGDSQFVYIKISAAIGTDRLNSLSVVKNILNTPEFPITDPEPWPHEIVLPESFVLKQNYPNPFNPSTRIEFEVPYTSRININVYNILGQKVKTLLDRTMVAHDSHFIDWDGTNDNGEKVSTGIYFYKLKVDDVQISKKMVLLK